MKNLGQAVFDFQNLIVRVLGEIESWVVNQGEGAMTFEAQITLIEHGV